MHQICTKYARIYCHYTDLMHILQEHIRFEHIELISTHNSGGCLPLNPIPGDSLFVPDHKYFDDTEYCEDDRW